MRVMRIGLALAIASTLVGCDKESGPFFAPQVPLAYVRFINAVPDTFSVDFRFIDQIEYSPTAILRPFRSFTSYEGAAPGTRPLRVAMGATIPIGSIFREHLGIDTMFFSFSTADEDFHAPNEFFRLSRFRDGQVAWRDLLQRIGDLSGSKSGRAGTGTCP